MILSAIGISVIAIGDPNLQILSVFATVTAIILTISHTFSKSLLFLSIITFVVAPGILAPFVVKYLGYGIFTSELFGVPKPFLIISSIPVFGVLSPTFFTIVFSILFIFPLFFYLSRRKKVRKIDPWNGGLSLKENEYFSAPVCYFFSF